MLDTEIPYNNINLEIRDPAFYHKCYNQDIPYPSGY